MMQTKSIVYGAALAALLAVVGGCVWGLRGSLFSKSSDPAAIAGPVAPVEPAAPAERAAAEALAAKVNGVPITIADLTPQVDAKLNAYRKFGMRSTNDELLKELRMGALEERIASELLTQEAMKLKLDDLEARVEKEMAKLGEHGAAASDAERAQRAEYIRKSILVDEYMAKEDLKDPAVPEKEIRDFYERGKKGMIHKDGASTRHVLVKVAEDAKPEERAVARAKIEKARELVAGGQPFEEVAKAYSECNTAESGGDLGYREKGYMPPEYDKVAFSQKVGEPSAIFETKFGFHFLKVVERKPAGLTPYEEIKDFLEKYLRKEQARKKMVAHIASLKEKAKVEIFL
jgi:peptidyl-prolyl cis-trans isomerase C